ncbi:FecR family protein [Robertkochia solimangrovi]|uniref:FecR family protein n=1 Tax=Robertkochia solimangrovi TaxID=2213046 RepID=UPI00117C2ACC|nr:FecR domain-containing protein [Robertkochia solimangrovi]TRZ41876.1 hypothetical protein DMZ48_16155 [Robertkochia solimangrovi]
MSKEQVYHLIFKYLSGDISESEKNQLADYLKDPVNKKRFRQLVRADYLADLKLGNYDSGSLMKEILNASEKSNVPVKRIKFSSILKYAAILILFAGGSYLLYLHNENDNLSTDINYSKYVTIEYDDGKIDSINTDMTSDLVTSKGQVIGKQVSTRIALSNFDMSVPPVTNTLRVPYGHMMELALSDGTLVILNSGSTLTFPSYFKNSGAREIILEGEAYLEVSKDSLRPFRVLSDKIDVQVLGTRFNTSVYEDDAITAVTLEEGSVLVTRDADSIKLDPLEQATLVAGQMYKRRVNVDRFTSWKEGKLIFYNDRFSDVQKKIERYYAVKIINEYPEINDLLYTGTFDVETIDELFQAFQLTVAFNYEKDNDVITIKKPAPM